MKYANIKYNDIANGEGVRTSLFVSGCPHRCKGCFNEVTWNYNYGEEYDKNTELDILDSLDHYYISGLSILGGEPLCPKNIYNVSKLARDCKERYGTSKNIWIYTGYTLEELQEEYMSDRNSIFLRVCYLNAIRNTDVLVDGRFVEELKDISLKFRGSSNQRIIDMQETIKNKKIEIFPGTEHIKINVKL